MRRLRHTALAALTVLLLLAPGSALAAKRSSRAKCTGSASCRACKNCRYCKHCARDRGTCGVCRRRRAQSPEHWRAAGQGH